MALGGGTFKVQNKVLPGTYINFVSAQNGKTNMGERGVVALGLELDWGKDNEVIEVTAKQFETDTLKIFGYDITSEKMKGLRDLFKNTTKGYFYKLNNEGEKATNTFATAKYTGIRGNSLKIVIEKNLDDETKYDVSTLIETNSKNSK